MPDHYSRLKPEPIEVIEAWKLGYHLGNVIKYIARAGHKRYEGMESTDPALNGYRELRDLRAAVWYLNRQIELRGAAMMGGTPPPPESQV